VKIKKFDARTEQEAIEKVKAELGLDALVLSIKTTKPKGVFSFMRNPTVEVTAAYDEKKTALRPVIGSDITTPAAAPLLPPLPLPEPQGGQLIMDSAYQDPASKMSEVDRIVESIQAIQSLQGGFSQAKQPAPKAAAMPTNQGALADLERTPGQMRYDNTGAAVAADLLSSVPAFQNTAHTQAVTQSTTPKTDTSELKLRKQAEKIKTLEQKLHSTEDLLASTMQKLTVSQHASSIGPAAERKYDSNILQMFYNTLTEQGVTPEIAEELLTEAQQYELLDIDVAVKVIYGKIVKLLGTAQLIDAEGSKRDKPTIITFIGPTGVGKTTTIAKLSSLFILGMGKSVGMITADTYRIAAVEQLKTYSEILGAPIMTAYNKQDISDAIKKLRSKCDIIIIDTAGRSHKHKENVDELGQLLTAAPDSVKYLVLSTTTKCEDILSIINLYTNITDFNLIFTKLDETNCLGSILNACYTTGKKVSYVTTGQNVPDDIEVMQPEKIAKALLGFGTI